MKFKTGDRIIVIQAVYHNYGLPEDVIGKKGTVTGQCGEQTYEVEVDQYGTWRFIDINMALDNQKE